SEHAKGAFMSRSSLGLAICVLSLVLPSTSVVAQDLPSFVYTNDDPAGPNTVSALRVNAGGALTSVAGSPFSTGGTGVGGGYFMAATRIIVVGKHLYVSNAGAGGSVSGFSINATTGALTLVPGSPFPVNVGGDTISLAATPAGTYLIAGRNSI